MISCSDKNDWFKKIDFYIKNEKSREQISNKALKTPEIIYTKIEY